MGRHLAVRSLRKRAAATTSSPSTSTIMSAVRMSSSETEFTRTGTLHRMKDAVVHGYSTGEEIANSITHGVGWLPELRRSGLPGDPGRSHRRRIAGRFVCGLRRHPGAALRLFDPVPRACPQSAPNESSGSSTTRRSSCSSPAPTRRWHWWLWGAGGGGRSSAASGFSPWSGFCSTPSPTAAGGGCPSLCTWPWAGWWWWPSNR